MRSQPESLISAVEAARTLGVHRQTITNWIGSGILTGYRVGPRLIRVDAVEILNLAKRVG
ncbi:excisionase family DNA-binding protein [Rhodococcus qingshengii]|uniref:excisionase family DNA-binding protein n=1 Tax=Rhodococcus qingshengii TaxID=334542 RepID=UPI0035FDFC57